MPRHIIKLTRGDKSYYMEWSTIVDAPVSYGMSLREFRVYYRHLYGEYGGKDLNERLVRVEESGTSCVDATLAEQISHNRAGPGESCLTYDGIIDRYCI